jgi:hypothetical protein
LKQLGQVCAREKKELKRTKENAKTFQKINAENFFVAIMSKFTSKSFIFLTIKI